MIRRFFAASRFSSYIPPNILFGWQSTPSLFRLRQNMAAKGGMTDDYRASAFRHLHDAQQLAALGRYDNAGHLIGFAGECAMKCKMKSMKLSGFDMQGHHPVPQAAIKRAMQRNRMAGQWLALVSSKKLFDGWNVNQRYSPDSTVTDTKYTEWLNDATTVISLIGFK